nr:hypothetical protein [Tanacetum cinerariifolium]
MADKTDYITTTRKNFVTNDNEGRMIEKCIVKIQGTFLVKVRDYAFNGEIRENAFKHVNNFLKIVRPIKINGLTQDRFRLSVFPVSLTEAANEWFAKECIGSITTWDNMVEKFILKYHHLSDHKGEEETKEDDNPNKIDDVLEIFKIEGNLFDFETPLCEAYREFNCLLKIDIDLYTYYIQNFKTYDEYEQELNDDKAKGTKWPMCTSDIDGFWNGGELPGMVRVGSMTYFQDHRWYDKLADGKLKDETLALKAKIKGSKGDATPEEPYANIKTKWDNNLYVDINRKFETSNTGCTQENQEHNGDPIPEPSNCKVRRFKMMKYSFNDNKEYISIKESEYLNHSKDSLDAYRELLRPINEGWVVTASED